MKNRNGIGFQSALLVNKWIIAGFFVLSVLSVWLGALPIAMLFLALAVMGSVSYLWGMKALDRLKVDVTAESASIVCGQKLEFCYEIENQKFLPLIWLEICQDVPKNDCLTPDDAMTLRVFSEQEAEYSGKDKAYMRRFPFLLGHRSLSFSCVWTGSRRGVYRPDDIIVRSGDGFGLTQSVGSAKGLKGKTFVVWPKIVPVNSALLLRDLWSGSAGHMGWSEDITILRDEKEYREGDSWKRIDWRTAARTDELYTKYFERIRPQSVMLVLDTAGLSDAEEGISITASLLWDLTEKGISAGLSLPATPEKEALVIRPNDANSTLDDLMFELSDHSASDASCDDHNIRSILAAAEDAGQVWIIGEDPKSIRSGRLYAALMSVSPRMICAVSDAGTVTFESLKG